jgi:recombination protein RecT
VSTPPKPESKAVAKIDPAEYNRPPRDGAAGLQRLAGPLLPQIAAALPGFVAKNAERMVRCLLTECQKTPKLLDCSPRSLFGGVIQVAQLGLELGGPAGQAYLLPFKGEATLCIGYKGFIALGFRAGVKRFTPREVREGDVFGLEYGSHQFLKHVPKFPADGDVLGYYAVVETHNGGIDFEYLSKAQALEHKNRFALMKSGGPWATSFDEMAKKTCIRKLAKRVPFSVEWVAAASLDEMADEGVPQMLGASVVLGEGEEPPSLRERLDRAKAGAKVEEKEPEQIEAPAETDQFGNPLLFGNEAPAEMPKH